MLNKIEGIQINTDGIKKVLKKYTPTESIFEYVWNGLDANANKIDIQVDLNELQSVRKIIISDNGDGINFEKLSNKFKNFHTSEKEKSQSKTSSNQHGQKGVGRLTFFCFASLAVWETVYKKDDKNYEYKISVESEKLNSYIAENYMISDKTTTGTTVSFDVIQNEKITLKLLEEELIKEFCWFIKLKSSKNIEITLNSEKINFEKHIKKSVKKIMKVNENTFEVEMYFWKGILKKENSKFYFLSSEGLEKNKKDAPKRRLSDGFSHSTFVKSEYFDELVFNDTEGPETLEGKDTIKSNTYKKISEKLKDLLYEERRKILKEEANSVLILKYEEQGVMPYYPENPLGMMMKNMLNETLKELYIIEPQIFASLNIPQKKTFVRFLDLIIKNEDTSLIFNIIEEVTKMDASDKEELKQILEKTNLKNITKTLKLIDDRFKAVEYLKQLLFDHKKSTKEVPHIQNFIEGHYWLFGEEYHLITAAEPKFKEALSEYWFEIKGEKIEEEIDHEFSGREMDVFLCGQDKNHDRVRNVVIELKRPSEKLGKRHYTQLEDYAEVISKQDKFNANNEEWVFILVGNSIVEDFFGKKYENSKGHGEKFLTEKHGNQKFYVKKWSEIINEFELRHNFIQKKLKLDKTKFIEKLADPTEILNEALENNTAIA